MKKVERLIENISDIPQCKYRLSKFQSNAEKIKCSVLKLNADINC